MLGEEGETHNELFKHSGGEISEMAPWKSMAPFMMATT